MKTWKKILAVLLVCLFALSVMQVAVSAEDEPIAVVDEADAAEGVSVSEPAEVPEDVTADAAEEASPAEEEGMVVAQDSIGSVIGSVLGTIVFSPFLLVDFIIWVITGFNVHIFYWWW